jgi:hypothetical protein
VTHRLAVTLLSLAAGVASAAVTLEEGGAFTWEGLTLFAPSDRWTVNEGPGVVALYRRGNPGESFVAGNVFLKPPDGVLSGALVGGDRREILEALVDYLARRCRERYGQAFDLERRDADGAEPATSLFFSDGERRVRAYAFVTRSGVYLLYLTCAPEEEERLAPELDRLIGRLSFR